MSAGTTAMPKKEKRNDLAVKVDKEVVRKARIVAAIEDTTLAELLSECLRPVIDKKLEQYHRQGFDLKNPPKR